MDHIKVFKLVDFSKLHDYTSFIPIKLLYPIYIVFSTCLQNFRQMFLLSFVTNRRTEVTEATIESTSQSRKTPRASHPKSYSELIFICSHCSKTTSERHAPFSEKVRINVDLSYRNFECGQHEEFIPLIHHA